MTLDNARSNNAIQIIKSRNPLNLGGAIFHYRCACQILIKSYGKRWFNIYLSLQLRLLNEL